jgi:hypothetical protein
MTTKLSSREKRLLLLCFGVLGFMATVILANSFMQRRTAALSQIERLTTEIRENETWLADRDYWQTHADWLAENMPSTESLGRAQGQLLEELQNSALDLEIRVERQTLLEPVNTANYREVSVNLRLYGDQTVILQWLATMQSPERFQHVKELEFEIDTRARTPKPQARCNLTLARWFKPETNA